MVAGRPVAVQSPARTRFRQRVRASRAFGIFLRQRSERGLALLDELPRWQCVILAGELGDLAPDLTRQRLALRLDEAVGRADGHRDAVGEMQTTIPSSH